MGENSKIEWCDHTFNPFLGCTKVSAACDHCYAEGWAKRTGQAHLWHGERRRTTDANWRQPLKWSREAKAAGVRRRVFCASLADVFDNQVPDEWRHDLWELIARCDSLDWLLLTKRPQNISKMLPVMDSRLPGYRPWRDRWPWPNVWLGTTVENQEEADRRIPHLLAVPAAVRFLSCEPLLGPIDLVAAGAIAPADLPMLTPAAKLCRDPLCLRGGPHYPREYGCRWGLEPKGAPGIDWVIAGGESGPHARPMHPDWARSLRDQCAAADVAFHFKQWGEWTEVDGPRCRSVNQQRHATDSWMELDGTLVPRNKASNRSPSPYGTSIMRRVGKARAGRLLDGREHNEFPAVRAAVAA